ncbi:MAG TPA: GAF domain-containing sensor histidine kinase [Ktedonobacterales bacterium]|nr:GAF domain-containing sensor histidine kinase [Ktedonobacterales bacterium]
MESQQKRHVHGQEDNLNAHGSPHLEGQRLLARVGWVVVTLTVIGLNLIALPSTYGASFSLTPSTLRDLHRLGLSPTLFSVLQIMEDAPLQLVYLGLGLLLFWRRSEERVALLCAYAFVTFGGMLPLFDFNNGTLAPSLAANAVLRLLALALLASGEVSLVVFFYVFPSGRFAPRWTRWGALGASLYWLVFLFNPKIDSQDGGLIPFLVPLFWMSDAVAQVYRYWRVSTPRERQQTKWVVFGFVLGMAFLAVTLPLTIIAVPPSIQTNPLYGSLNPIFQIALLLIPIFTTIAILRSHLWDIDLIINRTLVYSALTLSVVGLYVLSVGYLGVLFRTNGNPLISLIATGLVAVLFQPLRNWLQRAVNRLMYGQRDDPYAVIAQLGRRLESTLAPEATLSAIVETVAQALKLPYAAITLRQEGEFRTTTAYGSPVEGTLTLPLSYQTEPVGQLALGPRQRGESFSPADKRLLDDLARQIGIAVHAVRLTADLQRSRERLVTTREEERRRLRRDLHDGLGPTLGGLTLKVGAIRNLLPRDQATADALLAELGAEIEGAVGDIRRLVYDLRPPSLDELGLVGAIRARATQYGLTGGLAVVVEAPEHLPPLPAAVEVAAYRIILEAIANVARHAQATTCRVRLHVSDTREALEIEVCDDGGGLPTERHTGVGLFSMRERAAELGGSCVIESSPAGGVRVLARLPLPKE